MNTILDPSVLFMSDRDWRERQEEALCHLQGHLESIGSHGVTRVWWADELEELLWSDPPLPWRRDGVRNNQIVPQLYALLTNCIEPIDEMEMMEALACMVEPRLKCECHRGGQILEVFLRLVHCIVGRGKNTYFCIGLDNQSSDHHTFHCDCHSFRLKPTIIGTPEEWCHYVDVEKNYWPSSYCDEDMLRLRSALDIVARWMCHDGEVFRYEYEFSRSFIQEIVGESIDRGRVLDSMVRRLLLTQHEASHDGGLHDEPVKGQKDVRRFRVTGKCRIHYTYSGQDAYSGKTIVSFLEYNPEGKHERGL